MSEIQPKYDVAFKKITADTLLIFRFVSDIIVNILTVDEITMPEGSI